MRVGVWVGPAPARLAGHGLPAQLGADGVCGFALSIFFLGTAPPPPHPPLLCPRQGRALTHPPLPPRLAPPPAAFEGGALAIMAMAPAPFPLPPAPAPAPGALDVVNTAHLQHHISKAACAAVLQAQPHAAPAPGKQHPQLAPPHSPARPPARSLHTFSPAPARTAPPTPLTPPAAAAVAPAAAAAAARSRAPL